MGRNAEALFIARNFRKRRVHQTFGLHNIQTRGCTGFQLKLRQFQRFAARGQILAGERQTLLIIARVDIGIDDIRQIGEAGNVNGRIGSIERCSGTFLGAAILAEQIEQPRCGKPGAGGVGCALDRAVLAGLAAQRVAGASGKAWQRTGTGAHDRSLGGIDALDGLQHGQVLRQTLIDIGRQARVIEGRPPRLCGDIAIADIAAFRELLRQIHIRRFVVGADNTARQQEHDEGCCRTKRSHEPIEFRFRDKTADAATIRTQDVIRTKPADAGRLAGGTSCR